MFHDRNGTLTKARPDFAPDAIPDLLDIKKVSVATVSRDGSRRMR